MYNNDNIQLLNILCACTCIFTISIHDGMQGWGQFHLINSNSFQFQLISFFFSNSSSNLSIPVQFQFRINSMGVFATQMHEIIAIYNYNRYGFFL